MRELYQRITSLFARGSVSGSDASKKMQTLQVKLLADEVKDSIEHLEPYGFTANPLQGAEVLATFMDGDRSHGVVIVAADRRYRVKNLQKGEVAIYTDEGDVIKLGRGRNITITCGTKVKIDCPSVQITGNLQVDGAIHANGNVVSDANVADQGGAKTMAGMRTTYNGHTHVENSIPGSTNAPNQAM